MHSVVSLIKKCNNYVYITYVRIIIMYIYIYLQAETNNTLEPMHKERSMPLFAFQSEVLVIL